MNQGQHPTNEDILREIKEINKKLETYGHSINELKEWKIAVEAAKQALKEYQDTVPQAKEESLNAKAWASVLAVIGALTAVIVALTK